MDATSGAMEPGRGAAAPLSVAAVDAEPPPSTEEAVDKAIVTDDSMDPDILKKEVMAHYKAVGAVTEAHLVMPKGRLRVHHRGNRPHDSLCAGQRDDGRLQCLLRVRATEVLQYLMPTVNEDDAKKA